MKNVAREAGVSQPTVSLALRNHPSIPEKTRAKIRAAAERVGYRRNPMVSALMATRRGKKEQSAVKVAVVHNLPDNRAFLDTPVLNQLYQGIQDRADEQGMEPELFAGESEKMNSRRLNRILITRNIQAVLLPRPSRRGRPIELDWSSFATVAQAFSPSLPPVHRVSHNHFQGAASGVRELLELGFRRIGIVMVDFPFDRTRKGWIGGFYAEMAASGLGEVLEPLMISKSEDAPAAIRDWTQSLRPDAVLYAGMEHEELREMFGTGTSAPFLAHLDWRKGDPAGIYQDWRQVGSEMLDLVISDLYHNRRGLPEVPREVFLPGEWRMG